MSRRHRPSRAAQDYAWAISAQGRYENNRRTFGVLSRERLRREEARAAGREALAAGLDRIAEVQGTEFETSWRQVVDQFEAIFNEWENRNGI